jgi:hypothetical protein
MIEVATMITCECDAKDCKATAKVRHQFDIPQGWVRRQWVDTIASTHFGESDFSGNQQGLYCPEHIATLNPPLSPDVVRTIEQRKQLAEAKAAQVSDDASEPGD